MSGAIRGRMLLAAAVSIVVAVAVIAGFLASGTPGEARRRTLDRQRIEHLQGLERAVNSVTAKLKAAVHSVFSPSPLKPNSVDWYS